MVKQSIYLFIRALIIGVILNVGLYVISDPPSPSQVRIRIQKEPVVISQTSNYVEVPFLDHVGR